MIKPKYNRQLLLGAAILLSATLTAGQAHAAQGNYAGSISEKLRVSGCGSASQFTSANSNLKSNGKWSTATSNGNFKGKYSPKQGRNLTLKFDSGSLNRFTRNMKNWASDLCGLNVSISGVSYKIKVKINKLRTRLKGKITATASGSTSEGSGTGKYKGKINMNRI